MPFQTFYLTGSLLLKRPRVAKSFLEVKRIFYANTIGHPWMIEKNGTLILQATAVPDFPTDSKFQKSLNSVVSVS